MKTRSFGCYEVEVDGDHAIITRLDGGPPQPTFYEMQHMKCEAFGADRWAVEAFPAARNLVDGQNQRHLWAVERGSVPNLAEGL